MDKLDESNSEFILKLVGSVKLPRGAKKRPSTADIKEINRAFISPSAKQFLGEDIQTNKMYESIGDARLYLFATTFLYHRYGEDLSEGQLTELRKYMVGNDFAVMDMAKHLGLAERTRGMTGKKLLPNTAESIIGVLFKLYGYTFTEVFLKQLFDANYKNWCEDKHTDKTKEYIANLTKIKKSTKLTPRSLLNEHVQKHPESCLYKFTHETHEHGWIAIVQYGRLSCKSKPCRTKNAANDHACELMLEKLKGKSKKRPLDVPDIASVKRPRKK
ncbi:hypothetical protein BC938DRAFT_483539 [Jimgerdemannia flammicorona]|uniref:RNase III domain-containing protein n=1 Tax=Jimgerdemannia flammicorona TaxID=994334 RepID=A0A433R083_9FUNG|nr:hypothetical protein BC938DRAFT_483539 [Jimgerdemannia flammicorona]